MKSFEKRKTNHRLGKVERGGSGGIEEAFRRIFPRSVGVSCQISEKKGAMATYNGGWDGCPGDRLEEVMEISIGYVLR
jgi:hypothetical protein